MKLTISKSQWQEMGRKAGWTKTAELIYPQAVCVWEYNEDTDKYASDCDAIFSKKFADTLTKGSECPKCDGRVLKTGDEEKLDYRSTREIEQDYPARY